MSKEFLDSRDLQKRIDELEGMAKESSLEEWEHAELDELKKLKEECEDSGWECGITFIIDWHFRQYAEEYAEEVGFIDSRGNNPLFYHIDWDSWAESMKQDYYEIEFQGNTYLYREA